MCLYMLSVCLCVSQDLGKDVQIACVGLGLGECV